MTRSAPDVPGDLLMHPRVLLLAAPIAAALLCSMAVGQSSCTPDLNGDGIVDGEDLVELLDAWHQTYAPELAGIAPSSGFAAGGTVVTIAGAHLREVTSITIGGTSVPRILDAEGTSIVAVTPPGIVGTHDVVVTTPFGSATLPQAFEYRVGPVPWATILEIAPDPAVVVDASLRAAILATGLPWRVRDDASAVEMLLVPPGTFMMGCSASLQDACLPHEEPVHQVTLTRAFYLARHEVTQAEWTAVMGSNPSRFVAANGYPGSDERPVEQVSWNAAAKFMETTSLRLPTEAEWEFACRAGTTTAFNDGSDDDATLGLLAWYATNSAAQTHPVGGKLPNRLGFHDMHGNVFEWVEDWYGESFYWQSPAVDPTGPAGGIARVLRGGSWNHPGSYERSSARLGVGPGIVLDRIGLRPARTP